MKFRLLASSALLVACLAPSLVAQSAVDVALCARGNLLAGQPHSGIPSGGGGSMAAAMAAGAADDFNRPDSTNMGPDWVELLGDLSILNKQGYASAQSYMVHTTVSDPYQGSTASVDFFPITSTVTYSYVALIAAFNPTGDFLFIKSQDNNSDGLYDRVYFYKNHHGGSWAGSPYYFDLAVPTASGRMTVSYDITGDLCTLGIDRDFNGIIDETFSKGGILTAGLNLGTGVGIACKAHFDNWVLNGGGGWKNFGSGFPGANGEPTLTLGGSPKIGTQVSLIATSSAVGPEICLMFAGLTQASVLGFWGGSLYLVPMVTVSLPMPAAGWTLPVLIPNNSTLVGIKMYLQLLQSDAGAVFGAASSKGLEMTFQP